MANTPCECAWTGALFDKHAMSNLISCPLCCNIMFFLPLYQIWPHGHHSDSELVSADHYRKRAPTTLQLMQAVFTHGNATKFNRAPPILRTEAWRMEKGQRNQASNKKMQGENARTYICIYIYRYYACLYVCVCVCSYIYTFTHIYTHRHTHVGLTFFHTHKTCSSFPYSKGNEEPNSSVAWQYIKVGSNLAHWHTPSHRLGNLGFSFPPRVLRYRA